MRRIHSGMAAAALPAVGALALLGLALALSGSGGSAAPQDCNTTLSASASAGATHITVDDASESCGQDMWIVINQGSSNQDCVQVLDPSGPDLDLHSDSPLQYDHYVGETVVGVSECPPQPTATGTPTYAPPSPTPGSQCGTYGDLQAWPGGAINPVPASGAAGSSFDLELAGVEPNPDADQPAEVLWDWSPEGLAGELIGSGIVPRNEPGTLLEGTVPVSAEPGEHTVTACWWYAPSETWYYKDATFEVPEATPTPGFTPTPTPGAGPMLHCPQPGKWAIAVWEGPDFTDTPEALATCREGAVDAAYALDPDTQAWLRYFPERPDISNLPMLIKGQGVMARGKLTLGPPGRIAFTSDRDNFNLEIYVMNADGTGQTRLTYDPADDDYPAWSPDRSKIAFASERDGNSEIYVMNADGSGPSRLTNNPADDWSPAWSPDGSKIAFTSDRDGNLEVYVMNADGSGQTRLTYSAAADALDPAWSPDSGKIAFTRTDADGDTEIYVMNADGTGQTKLTSNLAYDEEADWSPDGAYIAFTSFRDQDWEIYAMKPDGTGQINLTHNPKPDRQPTWSPDGSQIAFMSARDGETEVYVMKANGSAQTNLTNRATDEDWHPDWSLAGPAYTPTPTPTPTPSAANQMHNCPQPGKWTIAVWEGANDIDTRDALATCADEVEAVYALDPDSQAWQRYFPERMDISNLPMLINGQGMIARGKLKLVSQERIVFDSDLYAAALPRVTPTPTSSGINDGCPTVGLEEECDPDGDGDCDEALCANDVNDDPLDDNVINDGCPAIGAPETGAQCANAIDDDGDAYLAPTPTPTPTFQDIYVMNPDGSAITRLTSNPGWEDIEPAWSPDRSMIAFVSMRDGNYEIYVMNADGSRQTRLTSDSAGDMRPAWSPDGSKIAFTSLRDGNWEIYVMNADGSSQTNLSNRRSSDDRDPAWSPDGSKIAFSSDRDVFWEIYVMNADGSGQTRLTSETATDERPAWSPDGSKIAFTSDRDGHWQIYVMNADGSGQTNLSNNAEWDRDPVWSPDGSKIAFTSSRYGNSEIYVMNVSGSRQTNLTNNTAEDRRPDW